MAAKKVRVYPNPKAYARGNYLAGIPLEGAAVAPALAQEWVAAGLVSLEPPARKPAKKAAPAAAPKPEA
jgi:hypothetical protein